MELKQVLARLSELEAEGKLTMLPLSTLYDPNGIITLSVKTDPGIRLQFMYDAMPVEEPAEAVEDEAEPDKPAKKVTKKGKK